MPESDSNSPYTQKPQPDEYITLPEAAHWSGYASAFLRELALKGKLQAKKSGITWLTTLSAVEIYKQGRSMKNIPIKYRDRDRDNQK